MANKKSLIVWVNDRGPFHGNALRMPRTRSRSFLDGFNGESCRAVKAEYIGRAAPEGPDDTRLMATSP